MSESSTGGEPMPPSFDGIEKLRLNREHSTGLGFDEVNFRGEQILIHRTRNLPHFMMILALDKTERGALTSPRDRELSALIDARLGDAMDATQETYPRLFKHAMWLVLEEARLREQVVGSQTRPDAAIYQDQWMQWRQEHVATGETRLVLSMFFDAMAPYVDAQKLTREDEFGYLSPVTPGFLCE